MKRVILAFCLAMALPLYAQYSSNPPQNSNDPALRNNDSYTSPAQDRDDQNISSQGPQYNYRVNVIQRTTQAVDYRVREGSTHVDFRGTDLMPKVDGHAKVTGHTGRLAIDATFHHLRPARSFGPEYLTYVLWAISSEGRPANLGEVVPNGDGDVSVQVTSGLQEFGLIVTAEPYFAVTRPSDLLVAENVVRNDTKGGIHPITARYELLQKGQYTVNISPAQLPATEAEHNKKTPLQILEAENAIAIAQASGADKYAPQALQKAQDYLSQAKEYQQHHEGKTSIGTVARAAAESAEDARLITLEKKQQDLVAAQRERQRERIERARSEAEREAVRADEARLDAQRQAEQRSLADQERLAAEQARQKAEQARIEAQQEAQQAAQEKAQAQQQLQQSEAARQQSEQQQQQLAAQADQARLQAQQAEQARVQTEQQAEVQRQRLLQQLNQVLQTKDTAKGLIVNVSDVLFDTNQATLKPGAKLRLAKVAGIILAYPDLRLEVDGYTDSTGSHEYNQTLSDRRAEAVRDFLVSQGVSHNNVGSRGFAEEDPVASNNTATGRQLNRRVELVVSGNAIGQNIGVAPGAPATTGAGAVQGTVGAGGAATTATPSSVGTSVTTPAATTPATTMPQPNTGTQPANTTTMPSTSNPPLTNNGQQPPK